MLLLDIPGGPPFQPDGSVFQFDSANSLSDPGTGVDLFNIVVAPADGSAASAYDRKTGDGTTSSTYPAFNGTPNGKSAAEYRSVDGGDYFKHAGALTTFLNSLHKDSAAFTYWIVFYQKAATNYDFMFGTTYTTSEIGIEIGHNNSGATDNKLTFAVRKGSGAALAKEVDTVLSNDAWHFVALSIDEAGNGFFYADGAYLQIGAADTFVAAYSSPSSAAASNVPYLGRAPNSADFFWTSGYRFHLDGLVARAMTKADLDTLYAEVKGQRAGLSLA